MPFLNGTQGHTYCATRTHQSHELVLVRISPRSTGFTDQVVREWLDNKSILETMALEWDKRTTSGDNVVVEGMQNGRLVAMAGRAIVGKGQRWQFER